MHNKARRWGWAWVALTACFALHVWDEAVHGFLPLYNANVEALRARWPLIPVPTLTFTEFVVGLSAAILLMALLTPAAFRGRAWLKTVAYGYGVVMLINGLQHIVVSLMLGRLMPGVLSSPLLVAASAGLLWATRAMFPPHAPG